MKRRQFIAALASAAAWPLAARAQAMPAVGFIDSRVPEVLTSRLRGFHQGLKDSGYVEGENVTVLYRYAENQSGRLPELSAEVARRQVAVIIASGGPDVILAAKASTNTIPIVFLTAEDPVRLGLVTSLARPGGNLTGINFLNREITAKRLELLRQLVPDATRVAVLINPAGSSGRDMLRNLEPAARAIGLQVIVYNASSSREIDDVFASFARERPGALLVGEDPFLNSRRLQLSLAAMRYAIPAAFTGRESAEVGGLMSYGSDVTNAYRQVGVYAGRILKGAKPSDMPVLQADKFELIINAQTARTLGITVSPTMLVAADEVIE